MPRIIEENENRLWIEDTISKHEIDLFIVSDNELCIEVEIFIGETFGSKCARATTISLDANSAILVHKWLSSKIDNGKIVNQLLKSNIIGE